MERFPQHRPDDLNCLQDNCIADVVRASVDMDTIYKIIRGEV